MRKEAIGVEGMSCGHCEIAVQDAIRKLPGIEKAKASRRKAQAVVQYDPDAVTLEQITDAIEKTGYTVIGRATKRADN